jgi:hypothetical protein
MTHLRPALVLGLGIILAACAPSSTPRIRVARDLGCTEAATRISRIDTYRWEVSGCGKSAIYTCTLPVRDCWRVGDVREGPPHEVTTPYAAVSVDTAPNAGK